MVYSNVWKFEKIWLSGTLIIIRKPKVWRTDVRIPIYHRLSSSGSIARIRRRFILVEQELLTIPKHLRLPLICCVVRVVHSLVFCVVFCRSLFVLLSFIGHCIVCPSSFYGFWSSFWYLQTFLCIIYLYQIRVITKLTNSEQSYKGKVKTHKFINR